MYIDGQKFASHIGGTYSSYDEEGFSGFQVTYGNGKNLYVKGAYVTLKNTSQGEEIAEGFNNSQNENFQNSVDGLLLFIEMLTFNTNSKWISGAVWGAGRFSSVLLEFIDVSSGLKVEESISTTMKVGYSATGRSAVIYSTRIIGTDGSVRATASSRY